jgi:NADH-quinone oxidoreductase subunit F
MIINAIPAYTEAPVAADLLKNGLPHSEGETFLLVEKQYAALAENAPPNIKVISVEPQSRFAFLNPAAALRAVQGENPLPKDNGGENVITLEDAVSPESKAVYVRGGGGKPKRIRVSRRCTAREILAASGMPKGVKALYLGFPMGLMLPDRDFDTPLDLASDYAVAIAEHDCALFQLAEISGRFADECCGQCVFGYEGMFQIHAILSDISNKKGKPGDLDLIAELGGAMRAQCLCEIGRCAANLVLSALKDFEAEIAGHITKKACAAAFCRKYITYHILQDKCTGCTECMDACDDDAIAGKKKFVHVIDQDECTQCGKCAESCEYGAIVKAGAIKPKCPSRPVPCA